MAMLTVLAVLFVWYLSGIGIMAIAQAKGRGPVAWFFYGIFFFPIALFHAVAMDSISQGPSVADLQSRISDLSYTVQKLQQR